VHAPSCTSGPQGQARSRSPRQDRRYAEDARLARHALAGQPGQPGSGPSRPARCPSRGCTEPVLEVRSRCVRTNAGRQRTPASSASTRCCSFRADVRHSHRVLSTGSQASLGNLPATVHTAGLHIGLHRPSHGLVGEDRDRPFVGRFHVHLYPRRPHSGQRPNFGLSVINYSFRSGSLLRTILAIDSDRVALYVSTGCGSHRSPGVLRGAAGSALEGGDQLDLHLRGLSAKAGSLWLKTPVQPRASETICSQMAWVVRASSAESGLPERTASRKAAQICSIPR
jgi:hypothetical protein